MGRRNIKENSRRKIEGGREVGSGMREMKKAKWKLRNIKLRWKSFKHEKVKRKLSCDGRGEVEGRVERRRREKDKNK